ncbi:MAG: hypothetical protein HYW69_00175 [Candidatus Nealsonbacteria bacterium]|nr:hypothetical protein [Candidatus Nealsonbacteria bacterium]
MPMPWKRESSFMPKPVPSQKPASMFERLGITRPAPKQEAKPQVKPQPETGPFGKEGYKSYAQLREAARKARFAPLPGTGQSLGKEKRVGIERELEAYGKRVGQVHGMSKQAFTERVLPQIKKDLSAIYRRTGSTESKEYKDLVRKTKVWGEGFPK